MQKLPLMSLVRGNGLFRRHHFVLQGFRNLRWLIAPILLTLHAEVSSGQSIAMQGFDNKWRIVDLQADSDGVHTADCDLGDVRQERRDAETTELRITARAQIKAVQYPWARDRRDGAYVIYYPYVMGQRFTSDGLGDWAWRGLAYPGPLFAPFIIVETPTNRTRLLHAADWPPKPVSVCYSLGRELISYAEGIEPGQAVTLSYRNVELAGDWRDAVDAYRSWLAPRKLAAGLTDKTPDWMRASHGFLNVQLENMTQFSTSHLDQLVSRWGGEFQWVQFWGQMSNYSGPSRLASPSLQMNEETGCCLLESSVHPRYRSSLAEWTQNYISKSPRRVGFYTRPRLDPDHSFADDLIHQPLLAWQRSLESTLHANVQYIDTMGGVDFGPALDVARSLQEMTPDLFIESVDQLMERPSLISGAYQAKHAFPRLGRYLFNSRVIFLGESNNGYTDWGARNGYRQESRAFLLGAKFDAIQPNRVVREICRMRDRVHWWSRNPVYQDTRGIIEPTDGVEATAFIDRNGKRLIAVVRPGAGEPTFEIVEEPDRPTATKPVAPSD